MDTGREYIKDLLDGKGRSFERNYLRYLKAIKNLNA